MAEKPEVKAKKQILVGLRDACRELGFELHLETHAGDAFSTPTLDITGSINLLPSESISWGVPFAIEAKRFDGQGKLTGRQAHTMRRMHAAGIAVFLIDSEASLSDFLAWIRARCPWRPCPDV